MNAPTPTWRDERRIDIHAMPQRIWQLFVDVAGWPQWNAGIERIELHGVFAGGSCLVIQPPGEDPFASRLLEVRENQGFTDETVLHGTRLRVHHLIEPLDARRTRVVFRTEVCGPFAADLGAAATEDFGEVLAALKQHAER
ncbi:SRPBCC family protein [Hydrocarboniphaga sp.]|uniref:SRPBCC family protein n=1 Tax=Hydrocarboniphaga sp. TaxID=2033016 RepID=UPI003D0D9F61